MEVYELVCTTIRYVERAALRDENNIFGEMMQSSSTVILMVVENHTHSSPLRSLRAFSLTARCARIGLVLYRGLQCSNCSHSEGFNERESLLAMYEVSCVWDADLWHQSTREGVLL
jgi:hypothetical protein